MINKFDELAKSLAQSVTRRQAFQRLGISLAGVSLTVLGLANRAEARGRHHPTPACWKGCDRCRYPYGCNAGDTGCFLYCNGCCHGGG